MRGASGEGTMSSRPGTSCPRFPTLDLNSWSADLMFALPGQTLAELDADLDALIETEAPHISLYGLTIEPNTPFADLADRGRLSLSEW